MALMRSVTCIIMNKKMIKALLIRNPLILIFKEVALLIKMKATRSY